MSRLVGTNPGTTRDVTTAWIHRDREHRKPAQMATGKEVHVEQALVNRARREGIAHGIVKQQGSWRQNHPCPRAKFRANDNPYSSSHQGTRAKAPNRSRRAQGNPKACTATAGRGRQRDLQERHACAQRGRKMPARGHLTTQQDAPTYCADSQKHSTMWTGGAQGKSDWLGDMGE